MNYAEIGQAENVFFAKVKKEIAILKIIDFQ